MSVGSGQSATGKTTRMCMNIDVQKYGARLYQHRDEGTILQWADVKVGEWEPLPKNCHRNVTTVCMLDNSLTAARGWFYFDLNNLMPYVLFVAHSAVLMANGTLCEITPAFATQQYPFIAAEESEDKYFELVENQGVNSITYFK